MDKQSNRVFKWFWPWQDQEEERWLRQMSLEGRHLLSKSLAWYTFAEGEPADVVYRLDFPPKSGGELPEYIEFFRGAGWEYLGKLSSWHYYRQPVTGDQPAELYTDNQSKIERYRRVLAALLFPSALSMAPGLAAMKKFGRHPQWFVVLYAAIFVVWIAFAAASAFMIYRRIETLKETSRV